MIWLRDLQRFRLVLAICAAYTIVMWLAYGWRWGILACVLGTAAILVGQAVGYAQLRRKLHQMEMRAAELELDMTARAGDGDDGEKPSA